MGMSTHNDCGMEVDIISVKRNGDEWEAAACYNQKGFFHKDPDPFVAIGKAVVLLLNEFPQLTLSNPKDLYDLKTSMLPAECPKGETSMLPAECSSCGATGLYCGMAEPKGVAVICLRCDGTGHRDPYPGCTVFKGRKPRKGIVEVRRSKGTFIVTGVGPYGKAITYQEFCEGKMP